MTAFANRIYAQCVIKAYMQKQPLPTEDPPAKAEE